MNKTFALCIALFAFLIGHAQDPVKWMATYKSISATEGEIIVSASIDKSWHIYSQEASTDGPIPTSLTFQGNKSYLLFGKAQEIGAHKIFDKAFGAEISSFSEKAEFRQKIKVVGKPGFTVALKVEYMCCDDKMCLPPKTVDLSVKVQ